MDEPLSNLDAKLRVQTRAEIAKLQARLGVTTLYVTHDQTEAMTMADRIVVIKDGVIQQIDNPQTLYDRPANRFVAGFIGMPPMNFFACRVENEGGELRLAGPDLMVPVPDDWRRTVEPLSGREITLGIRPESVTLAADEAGQLRSVIEVVEPMGSETYLNLRIGEQRAVIRVAPELKVVPEQMLSLTADPGKIHLFDAASGVALAR
jgi:multiple sugar transport system ATP-binding protein